MAAEPSDLEPIADAIAAPSSAITVHAGPRAELVPLFRLADDSDTAIAGYLARGDVLVAHDRDGRHGHVQMIGDGSTWELKSVAVVDDRRGAGLGRRLVAAGIAHARERGARRVVVATAAADTHLLRFYQQLGFRLTHVERDVFTPAAGYPPELRVHGIPVLDRVWLDLDVVGEAQVPGPPPSEPPPMPSTTIRRAGPTDLDALAPLMVGFNAAEHIAWDPVRARPAVERLLASDQVGVLLAAERAGALIGYVVVTWSFDLEHAGRDAWVTELFVEAAHRQHRVGASLLGAALAAARGGGAAALHLLVDPDNRPALALYRRAGFEPSHRIAMTHVFAAA